MDSVLVNANHFHPHASDSTSDYGPGWLHDVLFPLGREPQEMVLEATQSEAVQCADNQRKDQKHRCTDLLFLVVFSHGTSFSCFRVPPLDCALLCLLGPVYDTVPDRRSEKADILVDRKRSVKCLRNDNRGR